MIFNMNGVNYDTDIFRTDEEIKAVIGDVPKIATGTLSSTNSAMTLNFDFEPKGIIIQGVSTSNGYLSTMIWFKRDTNKYPTYTNCMGTSKGGAGYVENTEQVTASGNKLTISYFSYTGYACAFIAWG